MYVCIYVYIYRYICIYLQVIVCIMCADDVCDLVCLHRRLERNKALRTVGNKLCVFDLYLFICLLQ